MKVSILIPCYNEEKSIEKCIRSCLAQTRKADEIIVVNDGSSDRSAEILKKYKEKITICTLPKNSGNKSIAQEKGLKMVTGDVFITTDADTFLDKSFIKHIIKDFRNKEVAAVAGYVKSLKYNWLTACREIDYIIGQSLHKTAQSYINALYVIPGCAGAFRTKIFREFVKFDHDTLTEDLDFTYKIHTNGFKIGFNKKAVAYTQDPADIGSYIRQMNRWYSGGWQNLMKHLMQIINYPKNVFELSLSFIEGLLFSIIFFTALILNFQTFIFLVVPYILIVTGLAVYASVVNKRVDLLVYSPLYFILVFLNSFIFTYEFINEIVLRRHNVVWFKPERRPLV